MFDAIVLTKDRPAQLSLLIESIIQNAPDIHTIYVLWKASDDYFRAGYHKVNLECTKHGSWKVQWLHESDFKDDIFFLLKDVKQYFTFFTDDDIIYRRFKILDEELDTLFDNYNCSCVSLRLGSNTTVQYNYTGEQSIFPAEMMDVYGKFLVWNHNTVPRGNFGYPLSVDGHIFNKNVILSLLKQIKFNGPNAMEGHLQAHKKDIPPNMACLNRSVLVNTPLNRVQNAAANRSGEQFGISAEELNQRFLDGERPHLEEMDFSNINGCHQELDIRMYYKTLHLDKLEKDLED